MKDVIIIGGGVAGLTAGMYASRNGLDTVVFERMYIGGQASTTYTVDNYPGFDETLSGPDFSLQFERHARKFGAEITYEGITKLELDGKVKKIFTAGKEYEAKTVILAMGANAKTLGLEGEDDLRGRGVSYCATCDGAFYKGKDVVVVGGGDTAAEDALFLTLHADKVYLVHRRDSLRATKIIADQVLENEKIEMVWNSTVESILSDDNVTGVRLVNVKTGEKREIKVDGVFVAIGVKPNSDLIKGVIDTTESGFVRSNEQMETNIPGVFVAGDLRQKPLLQLVTAAADGAVAAVSAQKYIMKEFTD